LNSGKFNAQARVSRDLSTTYADIANFLKLNDSDIKDMISLSNDIDSTEQSVLRDMHGNVLDVCYTGLQSRKDVTDHKEMDGKIIKNHILDVPGKDQLTPLKPVMNKDGYMPKPVTLPVIIPAPKSEEPKNKEPYVINNITNNYGQDSTENIPGRFGIGGSYNFMGKRFGVVGFTEIGRKWDLEVIASMSNDRGHSNKFTESSNINAGYGTIINTTESVQWFTNGKYAELAVSRLFGDVFVGIGVAGRQENIYRTGAESMNTVKISPGDHPNAKSANSDIYTKSGSRVAKCGGEPEPTCPTCPPNIPIIVHDTVRIPYPAPYPVEVPVPYPVEVPVPYPVYIDVPPKIETTTTNTEINENKTTWAFDPTLELGAYFGGNRQVRAAVKGRIPLENRVYASGQRDRGDISVSLAWNIGSNYINKHNAKHTQHQGYHNRGQR
jgi:hypothetical protein